MPDTPRNLSYFKTQVILNSDNTAKKSSFTPGGTVSANNVQDAILEVASESGGSGGVTYDQQSLPSSPTRGQTWRERDVNNDVAATWFWNGTYWLSLDTRSFASPNFGISTSANTSIPFNFANSFNIFVERFAIIGRMEGAMSPGGATDSNTSYWTSAISTLVDGSQPFTYSTLVSLQGLTYVTNQNIYRHSALINSFLTVSPSDNFPDAGGRVRGMGFSFTKVGTPPNISVISVIQYRFVHP